MWKTRVEKVNGFGHSKQAWSDEYQKWIHIAWIDVAAEVDELLMCGQRLYVLDINNVHIRVGHKVRLFTEDGKINFVGRVEYSPVHFGFVVRAGEDEEVMTLTKHYIEVLFD